MSAEVDKRKVVKMRNKADGKITEIELRKKGY